MATCFAPRLPAPGGHTYHNDVGQLALQEPFQLPARERAAASGPGLRVAAEGFDDAVNVSQQLRHRGSQAGDRRVAPGGAWVSAWGGLGRLAPVLSGRSCAPHTPGAHALLRASPLPPPRGPGRAALPSVPQFPRRKMKVMLEFTDLV